MPMTPPSTPPSGLTRRGTLAAGIGAPLIMGAPLALSTPALSAAPATAPATFTPPDRYDEPLGIGLEGWPYPAPIHWQPCVIGGQAARMAYMDVAPTGRTNGKTVVLLHGKPFDSSYWAGPMRDLAAAGYRVIVPDQVGFNKSSKPDVDYSLDTLAELTVNLLSGLQVKTASLLGHAAGGMLAVRIATASPDHVDRLVLEAPIGLVDYRRFIAPQTTETLVSEERRRTVASYRALMRSFFPVLPAAAMEPFVEWRMRVAGSGEYERFCRAAAATYQMIYREPVRDQYPDIRCPTLVIVGAKDGTAPLKHYAAPDMVASMPALAAAAPDAVRDLRHGSLLVVPGVGHVPHLEAPDVVRRAVSDFLAT